MEVQIWEEKKGKPLVSVMGSAKNTPEQVSNAYKRTVYALNNDEPVKVHKKAHKIKKEDSTHESNNGQE
jgi:hypothetical protein